MLNIPPSFFKDNKFLVDFLKFFDNISLHLWGGSPVRPK